MPTVKLGLLDFGYTQFPMRGEEILRGVMQYAQHADRLGFSSFWLSEHHNSGRGWSNPETLLPLIAGSTANIDVGIAGILLAAHSPYRVALSFKLLSTIFPGRIDLGLANGILTDDILFKLSGRSPGRLNLKELFGSNTRELVQYFSETSDIQETLFVPPSGGSKPRLWKLSTSFKELQECLDLGLNICKSTLHKVVEEQDVRERLWDFKERFLKIYSFLPQVKLAVPIVCASSQLLAKRTFEQLGLSKHPASQNFIVGDFNFLRDELMIIAERDGIEEFVLYDSSADYLKKSEALEGIAEVFNLQVSH